MSHELPRGMAPTRGEWRPETLNKICKQEAITERQLRGHVDEQQARPRRRQTLANWDHLTEEMHQAKESIRWKKRTSTVRKRRHRQSAFPRE